MLEFLSTYLISFLGIFTGMWIYDSFVKKLSKSRRKKCQHHWRAKSHYFEYRKQSLDIYHFEGVSKLICEKCKAGKIARVEWVDGSGGKHYGWFYDRETNLLIYECVFVK